MLNSPQITLFFKKDLFIYSRGGGESVEGRREREGENPQVDGLLSRRRRQRWNLRPGDPDLGRKAEVDAYS